MFIQLGDFFFPQQTDHTCNKKTHLEATKIVKFQGMKIVTHETMRKSPKLNEFSKKKGKVIKIELKSVEKEWLE